MVCRMHLVLSALLALLTTPMAAGQSTWERMSDLPGPRSETTAESVGGLIYLFGDYNYSSNNNSVLIYDQVLNQWTSGSGAWQGRGQAASAVVDGRIYVLCGNNAFSNNWLRTNQSYDTTIGTWATHSVAPGSGRGFVSAESVDGKVYLMGGVNSYIVPDFRYNHAFDPVSNSWETLPDLPIYRSQHGSATIDGRIYLVGGGYRLQHNSPQMVSQVDVFDPSTGQWSQVAPLPTPRRQLMVVAAEEKIYAIGGQVLVNGSYYLPSDVVEIFDTATGQWSTGPSLGAPTYDGAAAYLDGNVYVMGGVHVSGRTAEVWRLPVGSVHEPKLPNGKWTVIVHGRTSQYTYEDIAYDGGANAWMWYLANKIGEYCDSVEIHQMNLDQMILTGDPLRSDAHHVLLFDWTDTSSLVGGELDGASTNGFAAAAGESLYAWLQVFGVADDVQALIGHSRGAVVVSETVRRMIRDDVEPGQVIYLDGEGAKWFYLDWDFDVWSMDGAVPNIRYDNIYQTYGPTDGFLGGYSLDRAFNTVVTDYAHGGIPYYLISWIKYDGAKFTFRASDERYGPLVANGRAISDVNQRFDVYQPVNGGFEFVGRAGWVYHGGGGSGQFHWPSGLLPVEVRLECTQNNTWQSTSHRRSLLYVRPQVQAIHIDARLARGGGNNGTLKLIWNGQTIETWPLDELPRTMFGDPLLADVPQGAMAGTSGLLELRVESFKKVTVSIRGIELLE